MVQLTSGAIKKIATAASQDDMPSKPILQILGIKKLQASNKGIDRFRAILSDGIHYYTSSMLASQLNDMVNSQQIEAKAVVQVDNFTVNTMQGARKVIVILDLTVLQEASEAAVKLGSPEQLSDQISVLEKMTDETCSKAGMQMNTAAQQKPVNQTNSASFGAQQQNRSGAVQGKMNPYNSGNSNGAFYGGGVKAVNKMAGGGGSGGLTVHPISSLTPYQNRWTIRARVTNKSSIRTWSNSRGEGKLFSVDLLDESGEIKATGFQETVDKFYEMLEAGKIYYISRASLKPANKQYTSLKNDYEMYLNNDSTIELCNDAVDLPQVQYNFVNIGDLENVNKDSLVDIIGVVKTAQDVMQIVTRTTNRQVSKRELSVVDRSEAAVNVTLWGDQAEKYDEYVNENPVIAVKGAKVSDFGGRSLSVLNSSVFHVNPDIPEAHTLRGWYDQIGKDSGVKSISNQRSEILTSEFKNLKQMRRDKLGMGEKPDYFNVKVTASQLRKENCLYKACPSADCNKKVIGEDGEYVCEKCNRTYPEFKYRLIMQANFSDFSESEWITCFQESGEAILNSTAENIGRLMETDERAFAEIFSSATFNQFILKLRVKMETYNDESRLRATCVSASPVNFKTDAKRLLEAIKQLEAM